MDSRVEVKDAEITAAFTVLGEEIKKRLAQHGRKGFISTHEILGAIEEEILELKEAVRSNKTAAVSAELLDVAVGSIFGVASLMASARGDKEVPKPA